MSLQYWQTTKGILTTSSSFLLFRYFSNCNFTNCLMTMFQQSNLSLMYQLLYLHLIYNLDRHQMASKLINREITNIIANYLYNRPFMSLNPTEPTDTPPSAYKSINRPLDLFLRTYFTNHKYLGGSERSAISDKVYNLVRYEYLLSHLIRSKPYTIEKQYTFNDQLQKEIQYKLDMLFTSQFYNAIDNKSLPKFLRVSQNKLLFKEFSCSLMKENHLFEGKSIVDKDRQYDLGDEDAAFDVSYIMNSRAPLTLRVNPLKITKYDLVQKLQKKLKLRLQKCEYAPFGFKIVAPKNINLLQTEEFQNGYFEIQDQGSQLAALRADVKPGELVLDFCGGSGGKSLALAHLLQEKGQIFIHEPREVALGKAKKRFKRAGITNVQFHNDQNTLSKKMTGKMDWVIVDAPCTGTGTLRRNPDIKLKFSEDSIKKNVILQQSIVSKALRYLKPKGKLLYITCSLLRQQNQDQVSHFTKVHNLQVVNSQVMKILPKKDGTDGFFAVVLQRSN